MKDRVFGQLTVIDTAPTKIRKRTDNRADRVVIQWTVQCSCGSKPFIISEEYLRSGSGYCKSCSCRLHNSNKIHGESDSGGDKVASPEYRIWRAMITRCTNPNYKQYKDYGGRGITVCPEWLDSYIVFLSDMGRKPSHKHSIERRKNELGYSKDNCYWATSNQQRRNRRTNTCITIDNKTQCLVDWLIELGVKESTYHWRCKHGYTQIEALLGTRSLSQ